MSELPSLLAVLSRRGRVGSVILVVLGLALIAAGAALTFGLGEEGAYHTRGGSSAIGVAISVAVVGLILIGLGGGSLIGAQARVAAQIAEHPAPIAAPRTDPRAVARAMATPFWICSDCRVVESGLSGCCTRCGNTVGFFQAASEADRSIAVSSLH